MVEWQDETVPIRPAVPTKVGPEKQQQQQRKVAPEEGIEPRSHDPADRALGRGGESRKPFIAKENTAKQQPCGEYKHMLKQFDEVVEIKFEIEIEMQKLPDLLSKC